eukprot:TRINITY_DN16748_c0_g1_i1.p1 TRINITY_DN16748_c0_g1~~TRINITY_DN16748_c0_g1_i1.p1  ORF type:complete len:512 (+),score=83.46 TRINITY_DN16748_c0_g1_i1:59-1594(+)
MGSACQAAAQQDAESPAKRYSASSKRGSRVQSAAASEEATSPRPDSTPTRTRLQSIGEDEVELNVRLGGSRAGGCRRICCAAYALRRRLAGHRGSEPLSAPDPAFAEPGHQIRCLIDWSWGNQPVQVMKGARLKKVRLVRRPGKGLLRGAHDGGVSNVAMLGRRRFISCGWDGNVRVWRAQDGSEEHAVHVGRPMHALATAPDNRHAAFGGDAGECFILDAVSARRKLRLLGCGRGVVQALSWADNGRTIAGSADRAVQLWQVADAVQRQSDAAVLPGAVPLSTPTQGDLLAPTCDASLLLPLSSPGCALCFFWEDARLAVGCVDGSISVWSWRNKLVLWKADLHSMSVTAIHIRYDRGMGHYRMVSSARDGMVRLWNANTGYAQRVLRSCPAHTSSAGCYVGGGVQAVLCCAGPRGLGLISPLDPFGTADSVQNPNCHEDAIRAVASSGITAVSASDDGNILLWKVKPAADAGFMSEGPAPGSREPSLPRGQPPVSLATHLLLHRHSVQK